MRADRRNAHPANASEADARTRESSLGARIMLASFATGALIALAISAGMLWRSWHADLALVEQRVGELSTTMVPGLETSLWFVDDGQMHTLLDGVAKVPGVDFVALDTREGERHVRGAPQENPLHTRTFTLAHGPAGDAMPLGTLTVVAGNAWIDERMRTRAVSFVLLSLLVLLGVSLIYSLLFRRMVTRHLRTMAAYSASIDVGRLEVPLVLDRSGRRGPPDDLDQVTSALNAMRVRIAEFIRIRAAYEETLEEHRDRLEHLVDARTRELVEKARLLSEAYAAESSARTEAARSAARFSDFAETAADGFWETDADERLTYVSQTFATAMGLRARDMLGRTPLEVYRTVFPEGGDPAAYLSPMQQRQPFRDQLLYVRDARGQPRWLVNQGRPVHSQEGIFAGFRGAVRDVTAQRNAEKALRASEQRLRMIADNLPALVSVIDRSLRFTFNNRAYANALGKPLETITGQRLQDVYDADTFAALLPHLRQALDGEQRTFEIEVGPRTYRVTYVPDKNAQGDILGIYGLAHDISLAKQVERELQALSRFDPLTGLANRRHYDERLREAVARSERSGAAMALMFLDLDHFKRINDTCGHEGGDAVLVDFARRLVASTRQTDTVARIAGDEFVIILESLRDAAEAETVARKIIAAMRPPLAFAGRSIAFSTTIGIAVRRDGETDGDALLKRADDALYAAKRKGRGGYAMWEP